jgi:nitroreductase
MSTPAVIKTMMNRKSIRKYTEQAPTDAVLATVVSAGQQAPFALQLCSLLLSRNREKNPFHAPLLFTICVDSHRLERVMERRGWTMVTNDLSLLLFGIQDAALLAENMVISAESLGLGSCFLGAAPYRAGAIVEEYGLPPRVFPLVQLAMGYPAEDPPPRPRYPLAFTLFEGGYPKLTDEMVEQAMAVMDEGYLAQDYYRRAGYQIPLEDGREETFTFDDYSWTEHISRKAGQWLASLEDLIEPLTLCGFKVTPDSERQ